MRDNQSDNIMKKAPEGRAGRRLDHVLQVRPSPIQPLHHFE
jgi:hypothetical protein